MNTMRALSETQEAMDDQTLVLHAWENDRPALRTTEEEAAFLQREVISRIDDDVMRAIERRHGAWIPEERLRAGRDRQATALPRDEYEALLREQYALPQERARAILGHYSASEDKVYVTPTFPVTRRVLAHERLHQLSDPRGCSALGQGLDEGVTEWLARDAVGDPNFADQPEVWGHARQIAEMLCAHAGSDRIKVAYFRGDIAGLEEAVDRACGERTFRAVADLAERGQYVEAAERLRPREVR